MLMSFIMWGVILGVTSDGELKNYTSKRIFQRSGVFLVVFNVRGVVFGLPARLILGNMQGVKRYGNRLFYFPRRGYEQTPSSRYSTV